MTGLETDIVEVKRETEKRLRQSLIAAYFGMPILLLFFYTVIFFAFSSIVVIFVPQSGDQQVEKILFVWNSLREIPEGHYEFGIVALAALQATIFIGSQNRVLGKEESMRASESNYLFNKFSFFISILISSILFVILVASIGNFSFWITLVIFWISTGLISLFAKSATEAEQSCTEASLEKLKNDLDRVSNVESGSVPDGNHPFRSVLSRCSTLFPSWWAKFSQYLKLLVANKLIWLQFIIFGLFIYFIMRLIQKSHPQPKTPTPAPPQTPAHTTPTAA